jgi:RNA polymerase sigma-70 factor (family 1)
VDVEQYRTNEPKLIELLANGSEYAFQFIYDRYNSRIYGTAIRYLKSSVAAQDVVQDVFLKLWFERAHIKRDQSLEAWLHTVAKNTLINRLKRVGVERRALHQLFGGKDGPAAFFSDQPDESYYRKLLKEALDTLSEQQRAVFHLVRYEGLSYVQAGERMGISPLTVKTHMSRALDHIRERFKMHGVIFSCILLIIYALT